MHTKPWVRARASREYWEKMKPAGGRPFCPSMSKPDNWGFTQVEFEIGFMLFPHFILEDTKLNYDKCPVSSWGL